MEIDKNDFKEIIVRKTPLGYCLEFSQKEKDKIYTIEQKTIDKQLKYKPRPQPKWLIKVKRDYFKKLFGKFPEEVDDETRFENESIVELTLDTYLEEVGINKNPYEY